MENAPNKPAKHVCLTVRGPMSISSDPEGDILAALADPDVLKMVRGMTEEMPSSPFTGGLFGMEEKQVNAAVRKMKNAGLICSKRVDDHHVYYLNSARFRFIAEFLMGAAEGPRPE